MSEVPKESFAKRNTLAILSVLRDLKKNQTLVMITHTRGQFISKILDVNADGHQFLFDLGSSDYENDLAMEAESLTFVAEPTGAKVEFSCSKVRQVTFDGLPTFICDIPPVLYFIQRREYFRVNVPWLPDYRCSGTLSNATEFAFRVRDISLGGLGLEIEGTTPPEIASGEVLKDSVIQLAELGTFKLDLQYIGSMPRKSVSNKGETISSQRLSFKFPFLSPAQERDLQRAIFELEKQQHMKARRFQHD
ncbi:flagellar brake protein [Enterobacteriaceae bacterium Kacie_13]|nr:flagellar brake protein [Enterobacteriaceae bacterium Kacie_13]